MCFYVKHIKICSVQNNQTISHYKEKKSIKNQPFLIQSDVYALFTFDCPSCFFLLELCFRRNLVFFQLCLGIFVYVCFISQQVFNINPDEKGRKTNLNLKNHKYLYKG